MNHQMTDRHFLSRSFAAAPEAPECHIDRELEVNVIYTTDVGTLAALKAAGDLACGLNARINLIVAQAVPWVLPVDQPPVSIDFTTRRVKALVERSAHGDIETRIKLYLCRERPQALLHALPPKSLVVIGDKKRWWRSETARLAKALDRNGHRVLFVPNS